MAISVHCGECGKTYQVRDEMAGRRGRCPHGHAIVVPAGDPAPAADNEFAFTSNPFAGGDDDAPVPKSARRRPARPAPEAEAAPAAGDDFSAFPTQVVGSSARDEEEAPTPKTGRHAKQDRKAAGKEGKPNLMPLILGGILAVLGIGGGVTLLVVSRGEAGPLREQAEAANKKAAAAEERAQKAEALKVLAETNLEASKKNPPKDPALADLQAKLKAAEKQLKGMPVSRDGASGGAAMSKELDPDGPGGKNDPVMPGGKLELDRPAKKEMEKPAAKKDAPDKKPAVNLPDGVPLGGKNWTAPGAAMFGTENIKGGDRVWLYPQEDAAPKAVNGKLTIKFRWRLRKGKELPPAVGAGLIVQEARQGRLIPGSVTLSGPGGEGEVTFDVKDLKGGLPVFFFVGNRDPKKPEAYSTMLGFQVDFGPAAK